MRTHRTKQVETHEALGIVISDGGRGDVISRLAAFVWGPVPEEAEPVHADRQEALLAAIA